MQKSIYTSSQTVLQVLPCLNTISQVTFSLCHFQKCLLQQLSACNNYIAAVQHDRQNQLQTTTKIFQRMDTLMDERLVSLNKKSYQIGTGIYQKRTRSCSPVDRLQSKLYLTNIQVDENKDNSQSIKENKIVKQQTNFIQKSNQLEQLQVFTCLICLSLQKTPFIWSKSVPYLKHIREFHDIQPDFEILVRASSKILFSHIFYNGELINLCRILGSKHYRNYLSMLYLLQQGRFSQIYVCSCMRIDFNRCLTKGSPIFLYGIDYFEHISQNHRSIVQAGSSHSLLNKNGSTIAIFDKTSESIFKGEKMMQLIQKIKLRLNSYFSNVLNRLVKPNSGHKQMILEMVSNLSINNSRQKFFRCLPYCPSCKVYFANSSDHQEHSKRIHNNQGNNRLKQYGLQEMKQYIQHQGIHFDQHNLFTQSVSKQQNRLINLQLYLLNRLAKACGECSLLFCDTVNTTFILHLYEVHQGKGNTASHSLVFSNQRNKDQQQLNQQQIL